MSKVADIPTTLPPQPDLSEHALFGAPSGSLLLNQTPREGHTLGAYAMFEGRRSAGTEIEGLSVWTLDEAHRSGRPHIVPATAINETGITLSPSSLQSYLPASFSRNLPRLAARLVADTREIVAAATATSSALLELLPARTVERRPPSYVIDEPAALQKETPAATDPPAYQAFKDLARWLEADEDDVAKAVGIGRTTPYSWKREGREPRADTVRRLYEYHSTLDALLRRLGESGLRAWVFASRGGHRTALLIGDLAAVESDVNAVLFGRATDRLPDLAWAPEQPPEAEPADDSEQPARLSGRRPRRARLP